VINAIGIRDVAGGNLNCSHDKSPAAEVKSESAAKANNWTVYHGPNSDRLFLSFFIK